MCLVRHAYESFFASCIVLWAVFVRNESETMNNDNDNDNKGLQTRTMNGLAPRQDTQRSTPPPPRYGYRLRTAHPVTPDSDIANVTLNIPPACRPSPVIRETAVSVLANHGLVAVTPRCSALCSATSAVSFTTLTAVAADSFGVSGGLFWNDAITSYFAINWFMPSNSDRSTQT